MQDNGDFYRSEFSKAQYPVFMSTNFNIPVPPNMITAELEGLYGATVLRDISEIVRLYHIYEYGADFSSEGSGGSYVPSNLRFKKVRQIIDKQARFLFSKPPDMKVYSNDVRESVHTAISEMQLFLDKVLAENDFSNKLFKAAKDCFIGRRVACFLNFNDDGITLEFSPSLEFIYDVDPHDTSKITKIVAFYTVNDNNNKKEQRIYRKRYWLENDGFCWFDEGLYDGLGELVEQYFPPAPTRFTYVPAVVVLNDALTGELSGRSEVEQLMHSESWYSRLSNADMDSERRGMNPVRYTVDMNTETTKDLSLGPGAYWDLQSDMNSTADKVVGQVGVLESSMYYSQPLKETLERIKADMYDMVDIPDLKSMDFKVASAKALRAMYWSLLVRCDEKMLAWRPALKFIIQCIMDGARLYPGSALPYLPDSTMTLLDNDLFDPLVENQYPLPEDEVEEKQADVLEVTSGVRSRKSYMRKWLSYTDDEADKELEQIRKEKEMFGELQDNAQADVLPGADIEDTVSRNDNKSANSQRKSAGKEDPTEKKD